MARDTVLLPTTKEIAVKKILGMVPTAIVCGVIIALGAIGSSHAADIGEKVHQTNPTININMGEVSFNMP